MPHPAWLLIFAGLLSLAAGVVWLLFPSIPWLGKLPGDLRIEGEHFSIYFPLASCLVVSLILTAVLWLIRSWTR